MRVLVHGAGRAGHDAWPGMPDGDAVFLDLTAAAAMREKVSAVARAVNMPDTVVAHSEARSLSPSPRQKA